MYVEPLSWYAVRTSISNVSAGVETLLFHRKCLQSRFVQVDSAQIRLHISCISNNKGSVDGFVRRLSLATRLYKHSL